MPMKLNLVSPHGTLLSEEADSLSIVTEMGELTILPGHIPLVANLRPGEARAMISGEERSFAVFGGFLQVHGDDRVTVLADEAERVDELVVEEIEAAKVRAEKALKEKVSTVDYDDALRVLEREVARLRIARKYKAKGYHR